jgi:hypothetical protein
MISMRQLEWMIEKGKGNRNPNEGEDPPPPPHGDWEAEPRGWVRSDPSLPAMGWSDVRSDPSLPAMGWSDEFEPNRPVEGEARKSGKRRKEEKAERRQNRKKRESWRLRQKKGISLGVSGCWLMGRI